MSLIEHIKPFLKILFFFGICPFTITDSSNTPKCTVNSLLYTWTILCCCIVVGWSSNYYSYFVNRTASNLFEDTQKITRLFLRMFTIFIYYVIIILAIGKRQYHVNLLIRLHCIDNRMQTILMNHKATYPSIYMRPKFCVLFFYLILNAGGIYWRGNITISLVIFSALYAFEIVTIILTVIYIRYVCILMISRFRLLGALLQMLLQSNLTITQNYRKLLETLKLLEEFFGLKIMFNKLISAQLVSIAVFDVVAITIATYSGSREFVRRGFKFRFVYHVCVYIVPHVLKEFLMISAFSRLGWQVSIWTVRVHILDGDFVIFFKYSIIIGS